LLTRAVIVGFFCLLFASFGQAQQGNITLGQSTQTITLTGIGVNPTTGNGTSTLSWSDCSYNGTETTCTLSGPFTGFGPGGTGSGTWDFQLIYPGNGPSPVTVSTPPGSNLFTLLPLSAGTVHFVFNESDGTSITFPYLTGDIYWVPSLTACTGNPADCGPGAVGQTPGATETGPVTGTFNPNPQIQDAITAGDYGGGFAPIAPGTFMEIYGLNLGFTIGGWADGFVGNDAPTTVAGTSVTVGGKPAFVSYVSPGQVNVNVASDVPLGSQPVILTTSVGGTSNSYSITVNVTEPGLLAPPQFKFNNKQYAVALFPNYIYVLPPGTFSGVQSKLAVPGDTIVLYGVGFGTVNPNNPAGVIVQDQNTLTNSLAVTIGGLSAQVLYDGLAPTLVGVYQLNVVVPDVPASNTTPLVVTLGGTQVAQTLYLFIGSN
jgi:uncharacterized protein (TIGR03437 family)